MVYVVAYHQIILQCCTHYLVPVVTGE